jgi:hypothetical protein
LIDEFIQDLRIQRSQLIEVINAGSNYEISGTYVHQDLIPHIASWVSPQFAIKLSTTLLYVSTGNRYV